MEKVPVCWVSWGVSYFSTYTDRQVWREGFLVVMRKEKSLENFQDHLWVPPRPACMDRLQQVETYAVYWERHGNSLMINSASVRHPVGFSPSTFTCRDTSGPLLYLPEVNGFQHPILFPVPFLQQS